jgi:8-oxo-dGTP pyrophosphatase MutT (NUDIX family)
MIELMTGPSTGQTQPETTGKAHAPTHFTISPELSDFNISPADFLVSRPDIHNVIAGAMVFRSTTGTAPGECNQEVLLLQRAPSDSFPLKWEIPAGTADLKLDRSIAEVAVRELWEETHLRAVRLRKAVPMGLPDGVTHLICAGEVEDARMDDELPMCLLRLGEQTWAVVSFLVDLEDGGKEYKIILQDEEHVRHAWLTVDEVENGLLGQTGERIDFVSEAMKMVLLEGFRMIREAS